MSNSPLQRAISRGLNPAGDLAEELFALEDYTITSANDAQAIVKALATLPMAKSNGDSFESPLHALAGLFQDVESAEVPAFDVLFEEGISHLIRIFDALVDGADEETANDLLFVLKVLAMYGTHEGAERVVAAAQRPFFPDAYLWHVVLACYSEDHPERDFVFYSLSDPLPPEFIAVALLDSANSAAIESDLDHHPFDSEAGKQRLREWLEDTEPENFSYAHSATAAIPFISNPERDQFLALAMDHVESGIQMEAAWAAGKLGREAGLKILARYCLDPNHSTVAQQYLTELERDELIPESAREPSFQAKAEFANWLAHPNELGQPPDELEIIDHRRLAWPPDGEEKPFWLIKYRLHDPTGLDDVDCGLVGSITFCLFSYQMHQRPPEDAYAIHCGWEMEMADLIEEVEVDGDSDYAAMLDQWTGAALQDAEVTHVAEVSHELGYPRRLVALARATLAGNAGWIVLDGPESKWYAATEMPGEAPDSTVLKVHIGRRLLGFKQEPDRESFLA